MIEPELKHGNFARIKCQEETSKNNAIANSPVAECVTASLPRMRLLRYFFVYIRMSKREKKQSDPLTAKK